MSEEVKDIQTEQAAASQTSSYRSIFKATSLFGGVQVYQILISVIKQKFVAVLLGTTGMGIQGLYQSGIDLIKGITSMGLQQSAVRDVSEIYYGTRDMQRINRTATILRRLVWITGLLGLVVTACFSPLLSKSLFGNYDYTVPFIILSVILLLDQICSGQRVLLQGMRKLKHLVQGFCLWHYHWSRCECSFILSDGGKRYYTNTHSQLFNIFASQLAFCQKNSYSGRKNNHQSNISGRKAQCSRWALQ